MKMFLTCILLLMASGLPQEEVVSSGKMLIVYVSRTNNTKVLAEMIQNEVGGNLMELELVTPYPDNYLDMVRQVSEENTTGFLPPLKDHPDIDDYNLIFIGFPTWDMQMPPPMKSFLQHNAFEGKTLVPFNTHGGYGVGSGFNTVRSLCPRSTVLEGYSVKGGLEKEGVYLAIEGERKEEVRREIKIWLGQLKLK
ncbi:flavodoxin family protein [Robertkochia flava]|uniref:flavodoxin family protein n=1 Tax=Robertkochia flava TaxID=3447986 RepID=UPI001CCA594D|nr:flavodoxin [Robertkochia marina]